MARIERIGIGLSGGAAWGNHAVIRSVMTHARYCGTAVVEMIDGVCRLAWRVPGWGSRTWRKPGPVAMVIGIVGLLLSCGPEGDGLRLPVREELPESFQIQRANLIVVGHVTAVERANARGWFGFGGTGRGDGPEPVTIRLDVEAVLFGKAVGRELRVATWLAAGEGGGAEALPLEWRARGIHYLSSFAAGTYYVADFPVTRAPLAGSLGEAAARRRIVDLLLPGSCSPAAHESGVRRVIARAMRVGGYVATLPKLLRLVECEEESVRVAACLGLLESGFRGQDGCLERAEVAQSKLLMDRLDQELLRNRARAAGHFREGFLASPEQTAREYRVLAGEEGVADFLRLMARHPDPALARRAREALAGRSGGTQEGNGLPRGRSR
jgi:hypothetical protein